VGHVVGDKLAPHGRDHHQVRVLSGRAKLKRMVQRRVIKTAFSRLQKSSSLGNSGTQLSWRLCAMWAGVCTYAS
jgi:hypothetical protein